MHTPSPVTQVQLQDGRIVMGDFQSFDKQGNIILGSALESVITSSGKAEERHMGVVLIPSHYQAKVELQVSRVHSMRCTRGICSPCPMRMLRWRVHAGGMCAYVCAICVRLLTYHAVSVASRVPWRRSCGSQRRFKTEIGVNAGAGRRSNFRSW